MDLTPDVPATVPRWRRVAKAIRRPRLASYWLAMYDWSGLGPIGEFIGLDNFKRVFEDGEFRSAALHNVWIFVALFVMTNTLSLFLAVLLDRKSWMRGPYRAIIFLPYILSPVVTGFIFEVQDPRRSDGKPVVGGGRYDRLLEHLGAEAPIPAVGCSFWLDRIVGRP